MRAAAALDGLGEHRIPLRCGALVRVDGGGEADALWSADEVCEEDGAEEVVTPSRHEADLRVYIA